jgi:hypothetical protein
MEAQGFDFSHYSSPLSSIHVVLQRLVKGQQVKVVLRKGGRKAYQWLTAIDHIQGLLESIGKVAERAQARAGQVKPGVDHAAAAKSQSAALRKK